MEQPYSLNVFFFSFFACSILIEFELLYSYLNVIVALFIFSSAVEIMAIVNFKYAHSHVLKRGVVVWIR